MSEQINETRHSDEGWWASLSLKQRETLAAIAFISPWIIGFIVFTAGPMIASLGLSFTEYNVLEPPEFVGFENYIEMMEDSRLRISIVNTFIYAVTYVPLSLMFALGLAMLLNNVGKAAGFFRTAFYMPSMTPSVAIGTLWLWLLNPRIGLINQGLEMIGIDGPGWTTDPAWIKPGIVLMSLWSVGSTVIIYLAGLRSVPEVLYEAAYVDGAGPWRRFWNVTLPMMSGVIFFTLVVNTISSLQIFAEVFTMYFGQMNSGPASSAGLFYNIYLFRQAFEFFHMGYASAMAWILFVIILALTLLQLRLRKRWVYYEGE